MDQEKIPFSHPPVLAPTALDMNFFGFLITRKIRTCDGFDPDLPSCALGNGSGVGGFGRLLCTLFVHRRWGNVFLVRKTRTGPLLAGAASAVPPIPAPARFIRSLSQDGEVWSTATCGDVIQTQGVPEHQMLPISGVQHFQACFFGGSKGTFYCLSLWNNC